MDRRELNVPPYNPTDASPVCSPPAYGTGAASIQPSSPGLGASRPKHRNSSNDDIPSLNREPSITKAWPFLNRQTSSSSIVSEGEEAVPKAVSGIAKVFLEPLQLNLRITAMVFDTFFVKIPDLLCSWTPHGSSLMAIITLYLFAQAMALVWGFIVVASSVMCTTAVHYVERCEFLTAVSVWSVQEKACLGTNFDRLQLLVRLYMNYAVLRISFFLGRCLFDVGWEAYGDFAHVRNLLNPQVYYASSMNLIDEKSKLDAKRRNAALKAIQKILLITPLLVLLLLSILLLCAPIMRALLGDRLAPLLETVLDNLVDKKSRLNRTLRFTFFIGLLQWAQQFHCQFPKWYVGLQLSTGSILCRILLSSIGPLSLFRLCEWFFYPRGQSSKLTFLFNGVPYHLIDNILVLAWAVLLFWASIQILHLHPSHLKQAGWNKDIFSSPEQWMRQTQRFKFMFLFCSVLHFARGVVSSKMGFTFAQNDLIVITMAYPCLLVIIWSVAYCAVMLRFRHLWLIIPLSLWSWFLCHVIGGVGGIGVYCAVWVHSGRQIVKLYGTQSTLIHSVLLGGPEKNPGGKRMRIGPRRSWGYGRKIAAGVAKVFMAIGVLTFCTILCLGILTVIQRGTDWFPTHNFISLKQVDENVTRISHAILNLDLYSNATIGVKEGLPEYAICDSKFWGLGSLDYSFIALSSYFPLDQVDDALKVFFPNQTEIEAGTGVKPRKGHWRAGIPHHVPYDGPGSHNQSIFWREVMVPEQNMTVIAIRGTDFWKMSDWLEDIRLWTEPVVFSLLRLVFPTIGSWSPHTSAMVTDTLHSLLDAVGLPDPEYKYSRLVRYIRNNVKKRLPEGHRLVLTGHSLGGGIAHIVAGLENLPVVSFSPPGAYQSLAKHLYWNARERRQMHESAHNRTVTFLAENDMIGRIFDTHGGLVQTITCNTDHLGPLGCHMLENTVCNLIRHCHNDYRWQGCWFSYEATPMYQGVLDFIADSAGNEGKGSALLMMLIATLVSIVAAGLSTKYIFEKL